MTTNEKRIFFFTSLNHFLTHFLMLTFPALVMPISRDLNVPVNEVFSAGFIYYLLYGIMSVPWGFASDKLGPRYMMAAGMILAGIGSILAGFANSLLFLTLALTLTGLGSSSYHPSGLALLSKGMKKRGRILGLNGVFGNMGIAAAPLIAGIIMFFGGWQMAFIISGCIAILSGMTSLFIPFSVEENIDIQKSTLISKSTGLTLFFMMCGVLVTIGLTYRAITTILPSLIELRLTDYLDSFFTRISTTFNLDSKSIKNMGTLNAALITGSIYLIGILGQLAGGFAADRFDLRKVYILFFLAGLPFLIAIAFIRHWLFIPAAGIFAFFLLGVQPVENSLIAMITPPRWRSSLYGIKFTITFGAGSLALYAVSLIEKHADLNATILFPLACFIIGMVIIGIMLLVTRHEQIRHRH